MTKSAVRRQPHIGVGDVFGLPHAAERRVSTMLCRIFSGIGLDHVGGDEARRNRVHANLVLAQFARPDAGSCRSRPPWWLHNWSGRSCRTVPPRWMHSGSLRRLPRSCAARLRACRRTRLSDSRRSTASNCSSLIMPASAPSLHLDELTVTKDAGVVDQHIDCAPARRNLLDRGFTEAAIGDVDPLERCRPRAPLPPSRPRRPRGSLPARNAAPWPGRYPRRAGDDDDLVLQSCFDHEPL